MIYTKQFIKCDICGQQQDLSLKLTPAWRELVIGKDNLVLHVCGEICQERIESLLATLGKEWKVFYSVRKETHL